MLCCCLVQAPYDPAAGVSAPMNASSAALLCMRTGLRQHQLGSVQPAAYTFSEPTVLSLTHVRLALLVQQAAYVLCLQHE